MIHLFCNLYYGEPYLRAAAEFAREHGVGVRVVLSARVAIATPCLVRVSTWCIRADTATSIDQSSRPVV